MAKKILYIIILQLPLLSQIAVQKCMAVTCAEASLSCAMEGKRGNCECIKSRATQKCTTCG
jgi:hypothetical protein